VKLVHVWGPRVTHRQNRKRILSILNETERSWLVIK
jgi:hypothetical protein